MGFRDAVAGLLYTVVEVLPVWPHPGPFLEVVQGALVVPLFQQQLRLL